MDAQRNEAQASLRLPGGSEAGAGQALSRLTAPRRARLPPQRGLPGLACLWRGTQLTSWTPELTDKKGFLGADPLIQDTLKTLNVGDSRDAHLCPAVFPKAPLMQE
uniref:Uncharacterized protein n=1 Tax=Rangifer tarandus platyrhynchus TaxID=3082113 RepID=A0ACB0E925_RANTA|nr:unnamed protein product [Rangifer tarandus platyrhynchus]